jgi:hypothetical protein
MLGAMTMAASPAKASGTKPRQFRRPMPVAFRTNAQEEQPVTR